MQAVYLSEMLVPVTQTTWHYFSGDSSLLKMLRLVLVSTTALTSSQVYTENIGFLMDYTYEDMERSLV
jgi:hypothetical protein